MQNRCNTDSATGLTNPCKAQILKGAAKKLSKIAV